MAYQIKIYTVTMLQYGDKESHHYLIGAFTHLADAYIQGRLHQKFRDNKYEPYIEEMFINQIDGPILQVSNDTALSFAKLVYPEKFDSSNELIEE